MIRLNYIREARLAELREAIPENIEKYKQEKPFLNTFFGKEDDWLCESSLEVAGLPALDPSDKGKADADNAIALHKALTGINESQASDERLWVWLAHGPYWNYMRQRWNLEKKGTSVNVEAYILEHYFVANVRHLVRHGIARLWWFAHITHDKNRADPYELTRVMLEFDSDHRQSLLERAFSRNQLFVQSILDRALYWHEKKVKLVGNRKNFRSLCKELNLHGGAMLLDCLEREDVFQLVDEFVERLKVEENNQGLSESASELVA
jgi:hypothetical protein